MTYNENDTQAVEGMANRHHRPAKEEKERRFKLTPTMRWFLYGGVTALVTLAVAAGSGWAWLQNFLSA